MAYQTKITRLPKSEVKLEASLDASLLSAARARALKKLSENLEVDGFRKGFVPENVVIERVGEGRILEDAAEILLNEHFPKMVEEQKLDAVGNPQISISKLALGNPLEFSVRLAVVPEINLPDYKKIASKENQKKEEVAEASDKEVEDVLLQIRKNKAHHDYHKNNPQEKDHSKHPDYEKEENLPPLDDELAKSAGNFKNLEELKSKIKENLVEDKKFRNLDKKRAAIIEELLQETSLELPGILVESEVNRSMAQTKDDVARAGGKFSEYLSYMKKTEEELRKEMVPNAEKRAKVQLILNKIAEAEKLEPNKEILESETKKILEMYPEAAEASARVYVATQLLNTEVLKFLESQK